MGFEGVSQGKIGGAVVEGGPVVKDTGLGNPVADAIEEAYGGVCSAAWASHLSGYWIRGARVRNLRNNAAETVGGKAVSAANGARAEVGIQGVVVFGDVSVAAPQGKVA